MKNKLAVTFGLVALALSGLPCVCSAQCSPDFIEIEHKVPTTVFAPGANPGPAFSSATTYRLRVQEEREFWSTSTPSTLTGKRYYATLPTDLFMALWRTSPDFAKINNSRAVATGNNITHDIFQKFMASGGVPLLVSLDESLAVGRSKTLNLTVRKWTALPAAPVAPPGGFAPSLAFGANAQPFEASNQYPLSIPFKVVERCQK